jgi:hypothetical protein
VKPRSPSSLWLIPGCWEEHGVIGYPIAQGSRKETIKYSLRVLKGYMANASWASGTRDRADVGPYFIALQMAHAEVANMGIVAVAGSGTSKGIAGV